MKKLLLCLALLIGLRSGFVVIFDGYPVIEINTVEITIQGITFPFEDVGWIKYVFDNLVM